MARFPVPIAPCVRHGANRDLGCACHDLPVMAQTRNDGFAPVAAAKLLERESGRMVSTASTCLTRDWVWGGPGLRWVCQVLAPNLPAFRASGCATWREPVSTITDASGHPARLRTVAIIVLPLAHGMPCSGRSGTAMDPEMERWLRQQEPDASGGTQEGSHWGNADATLRVQAPNHASTYVRTCLPGSQSPRHCCLSCAASPAMPLPPAQSQLPVKPGPAHSWHHTTCSWDRVFPQG